MLHVTRIWGSPIPPQVPGFGAGFVAVAATGAAQPTPGIPTVAVVLAVVLLAVALRQVRHAIEPLAPLIRAVASSAFVLALVTATILLLLVSVVTQR